MGLTLFVRGLHLGAVANTPFFDLHRTFVESDMHIFDGWAQRIVAGDILGREPYQPLGRWQLATAPAQRWTEWYGSAPVFLKAPLYPYLIALLYVLFGEPMLPLAVLQILASAMSALLLLRLGTHLAGDEAGLATGLLFAVYAPAIHFDVVMLRGPFITLVALAATWQTVCLLARPTGLRAAMLGATLGAAVALNEGFSLLPALVVALLAWCLRRERILALRWTLGLLAGLALALSPIVARNLAVGVSPFQIAVTPGTVYAVFNSAGSDPYLFRVNPGALAPIMERAGGSLLGAIKACLESFSGPSDVGLFYLRKGVGLLVPFENPDNANFYYAAVIDPLLAVLPGYAVLLPLGVLGFGLIRGNPERALPLVPASLTLLLSIVVALPLSRYRATLAGVWLTPLAGVALGWMVQQARARRLVPLAAGMLACGLVFGATRGIERTTVFGGVDPNVYYYRPPEFLIAARAYAMQGRYGPAAGEMRALARLNPARTIRASALLAAAEYHAKGGDRAAAAHELELAALAGGDRDSVFLLVLGDAYRRALGDEERALACYTRATALNPPEAVLEALRQRLAGR